MSIAPKPLRSRQVLSSPQPSSLKSFQEWFLQLLFFRPPIQKTEKSPEKLHVSRWIWGLFITSFITWFIVVFISLWRPVLFPLNLVNLNFLRPLPAFLEPPQNPAEIWWPIAASLILCISLRGIPVNNWTRLIIRFIIAVFAVRYLIWRGVATLNTTHWISIILSLIFFINELVWVFSYLLYYLQSTWTTDNKRSIQADFYQQDVLAGRYLPSVDVFIPTYKEPDYIVRRTVIGCQAMDYPNKTIYILDDTRRPHIRAMANELGCRYITRPDNKHAKAGNLNNALPQTSGELITIMDADFVPFRNFLTRTVGFFQDKQIDLLQTPQFFYNPDYYAQNLGLSDVLPNDMEHFFGHVQPGRDIGNAVVCCGTSYVVRRRAIEAIGGYYTRCCVEDYQTSIRLLTHGFRLSYLNEVLSMGESTRTFTDFVDQRLRWLQGNLQVYFCGTELPIWSKLNWFQKSYHITLILFSLNPIIRFIALTVPIVSLYLGPSPLSASIEEYLYYAIPFLILYSTAFTWAANYRMSAFWNEVYETAFCFPALGRLWLMAKNPFAKASTATRKGVKLERKNANLHISYPLLILIVLSIGGLVLHYGGYWVGAWVPGEYEYVGKGLLVFWVLYNTLVMSVAVLSGIDQPVRRVADRFPLRTACKITAGSEVYWGYTNDLSEMGTNVTLTSDRHPSPDRPVILEFVEHEFSVKAAVVRVANYQSYADVSLEFSQVTLGQTRQLVKLLYCDMTWWKQRKKTGVLDSLLSLLASFLHLRPILRRYSS